MRGILVILFCLLPIAALAQEDDRGFLTRLLEENLSGAGREVRIEGFEGALSSQARIADLTIADDEGIWLRLVGVELDWTRSALLAGRLEVNRLAAEEIVLERLPGTDPEALPSPEAVPFTLPDLPVSVQIGALQARRISLGAAVLGQPVAASLDGGLTLDGGVGSGNLRLVRLDAVGGRLELDGSFANTSREVALRLVLNEPAGGIAAGLLGIPGAPALGLRVEGAGLLDDLTMQVALASDATDRFAGSIRLTAEGDAAQGFAVDLAGDVTPLFLPDYQDFFGPDVSLQASGRRAASGALSLDQLALRSAALSLSGALRLAPDGLPEAFSLALDLANPAGSAPVLLPLPGDPVRVSAARLRLDHDSADDGWRLEGVLQGLDAPALRAEVMNLNASGRIGRSASQGSVGGSLRFDGTGIAFADLALATALGDALRGQARFFWREGEPLALRPVTLQGAGLDVEALVSVEGPATALTLSGTLDASVADLGRLSGLAGRELGGAAQLGWRGTLTPLSGAFDGVLSLTGAGIRVGQTELDRLLAARATIRLDAARGPEGVHLRDATVAAPGVALAAQGWIRSSGPDLVVRADLADLSVLGDGRAGAGEVTARLTGTGLAEGLRMTAQGTGTNLQLGQPEIDGLLRGKIALDLLALQEASGIRLERFTLDGPSFGVNGAGLVGALERDLNLQLRLQDLSVLGPRYRGAVSASLGYALREGREDARLSAEMRDLAIGQPEVDRLLAGATRASAEISREGGVLRLNGLRLDNPAVAARAEAVEANGTRRLDLSARLTNLGLVVPQVPGPLEMTGRVDEAGGTLTLDLGVKGPGGIAATVAGTAALDFATADLRVQGTADAALANAFLGPVAISGPLRADLRVDGRPGLDALSGQLDWTAGRVTLADPPFAFSGVAASVGLSGGRAQIALEARSDAGGQVSVSGPVRLSAPFDGTLEVALAGLVLRDPQLYQTSVSGRLGIAGPLAGGARISGDLVLDGTELRIPSSGLGGVAAIPDMRHVGEPAVVRQTRARAGLLDEGASQRGSSARAYPLDITVSAPRQVFIRGRGLDAELGGDFRITGTSANVVPAGGLEMVRGRLDLLGKRFAFTEGRLQMEGSLIPVIRLVATTDTVDGQASVIVDGPADAPEIRFVSVPELPEEEVVARLLFGRGLTTLTPVQAAQLASAVATLTGRGGGGIVDRLRKSFGLDDFDVTAAEGGAAAVRAGKYLSENVYVDVTVDSEGKSAVSLNLDISPSLTVRGRAGADGQTGVGLFFERDY